MAVENNLQANNAISKHEMVTIDRPVNIRFEYTGSGNDIPVICQVQAKGFVNGVFTNIGLPLYSNRLSSSTQENPIFELDFAEIIGRHLDDTFKKTMNGVTTWPQATESSAIVNQVNDTTNPDAEGSTKVKFYAKAWCVNNLGFLELTDEDEIPWTDDHFVFPVRVTLPENFLNGSSFSNLLDSNNATFPGICNLVGSASAALSRYATSCPRNLRRTIHKDWGVPLGLISYNQTAGLALISSFNGTITATGASQSDTTNFGMTGTGSQFKTMLYPISLFAPGLVGATSVSDINSEVSFTINATGVPNADTLLFDWVDNVKSNSKGIYWINDYNCLDYYLFDGGISISYENENSTYLNNRDYTNPRGTSRNIMSGKSTEKIKVFTTALNKEALIWLQGIGRSRRVYEYDHDDNQRFIPIIIEGFETTVLNSVDRDAVSVEITYTKSIIATR